VIGTNYFHNTCAFWSQIMKAAPLFTKELNRKGATTLRCFGIAKFESIMRLWRQLSKSRTSHYSAQSWYTENRFFRMKEVAGEANSETHISVISTPG
jgi:hypothetical protein